MRTDYLGVLASRAQGVAPVLRPVTPSRFEPAGPQADLQDLTDVEPAHAAAVPAETADRDRRLVEPRGPDRDEPGLLPGRQPVSVPQTPVVDVAQPTLPTSPPSHQSVASRTPEVAVTSRDAATSRRNDDLTRIDRAAVVEGWPLDDTIDSPAREAAVVRHTEPAVRTDVRVAPVSNQLHEAPSQLPTVVVRIGRVDVRAVHPAPPAAPPQRPRQSAGPSLADHLLARDRGKR